MPILNLNEVSEFSISKNYDWELITSDQEFSVPFNVLFGIDSDMLSQNVNSEVYKLFLHFLETEPD